MDLSNLSDEELEQLLKRFENNKKPTPQPNKRSVPEELVRQLGLTARAGIQGPASFASIVADPLNVLANLISGSKDKPIFPPFSKGVDDLLGKDYLNLPKPETSAERIIQEIGTAGSGVGSVFKAAEKLPKIFGPKATPVKEFFTMGGPTFQTAGGAAAATALGMAKEGGRPPIEQLLYGIAGGTVVPSGGASTKVAADSIARGGKALVKPFTKEGREVIVGNVLNQLARDPVRAKANLEASTPLIKGSMPLTSGASKDVGLASAETPIKGLDQSGKFAERIANNNAARRILMGKYTDEQKIAQSEANRDFVTAPLRNKAFASAGDNVTDVGAILSKIDDVLKGPTGSKESVANAMKHFRDQIKNESGNVQRLDGIRQNINDYISGKIVGAKADNFRLAVGELSELRNFISKEINKVAPGYQKYLDTYSKLTTPISQQQKIRDIEIKTTDGGVVNEATGFEFIRPPQFRKLVTDRKGELKNLLTKTQLSTLQKISKDIDLGAQAQSVKQAGSETFKNFSVANVIGDIIGKQTFGEVGPVASKVTLPLQFLYNAPDRQVTELLLDAMLDPKLASKLLGKASQKNIQSVGQQLQEKALNLGFGSFLISPE